MSTGNDIGRKHSHSNDSLDRHIVSLLVEPRPSFLVWRVWFNFGSRLSVHGVLKTGCVSLGHSIEEERRKRQPLSSLQSLQVS
jgi:hypothetical protein